MSVYVYIFTENFPQKQLVKIFALVLTPLKKIFPFYLGSTLVFIGTNFLSKTLMYIYINKAYLEVIHLYGYNHTELHIAPTRPLLCSRQPDSIIARAKRVQ